MPILTPTNQYSLLLDKNHKFNSCPDIFYKYLKIASDNLYRNAKTLRAHINFRNDLIKNISIINRIFKCNISFKEKLNINNYYQYLFNTIFNEHYEESDLLGTYIINSQNLHLYYYVMSGLQTIGHWIFTDSSYTILICKNLERFKDKSIKSIKKRLNLLKLEIDLLKASGLTLILIIQCQLDSVTFVEEFISNTLKDDSFSEIHFNLEFSYEIEQKKKYEPIIKLLLQNYDLLKCYFYLYGPFLTEIASCNKNLKLLQSKPFFKFIGFNKEIKDVFEKNYFYVCSPFPFCVDGFTRNLIKINFSNIALYDTDDEHSDFTPSCFSDLGFGFIKSDDFLNFHKGRIQIYYENNTIKYCDFEDLHILKPDLYVKDTLYLMEADKNKLDKVDEIFDKANLHFIDDFKRKHIISFQKENKILNLLSYVTRAVRMMTRYSDCISLKSNQVFAALEACSLFLDEDRNIDPNKKKQKNDKDEPINKKDKMKGFIYQVHTGEGKSYIIQTTAAVQALMGKTVHIATSNIFLAIRDYYDSFVFFKKLGIKSSILLHKSELPTFSNDNNDNYNNDDDTNFKYRKELFPKEFFGDELFENSSGMNIGVCGTGFGTKKQTASVIYSTFINFESFYLRLMEMRPSIIKTYFENCTLLIDEADSILIDELTNGTILSKPMNTNGKEILIYVYQCKAQNLPPIDVLNGIKKIWPNCTDMNEDDIKIMYKEIDLVNTMEFINGKKYCIENMEIDYSMKENVINKVLGKIKKVKDKAKEIKNEALNIPIKAIKQSIEMSFGKLKRKKKHIHRNKTTPTIDTNNDDKDPIVKTKSEPNIPVHYGITEEEKDKLKQINVNYIVPFDYDHKGILEPNKEFNGFVQQFIAIKEMFSKPDEYKHMFIKDVSMNYLYVSHPIFVKLYGNVCGFTGTIGGDYEKGIFKDQYNLGTLKIPRNNPNRRIDMPITLCRSIKYRNKRIVNEVIQFIKRGNPILVIFQDLNELLKVHQLLKKRGINNVNVFDGRDPSIKPDFIAGRKGAVSLGSNVCGRGTDIKNPYMPLHIIISYYTSNIRVMQQAFGRTGRKGTQGTVHIICLKKQYFKPLKIVKDKNMNDVLIDFKFKNKLQVEFIDKFKEKREWIFMPVTKSQKLDYKTIGQLREAKINVNRIVAYKYKFPLCLSIETFLMIQAQKIFSLFNCPNCMYTWILFQRYIREMIFESWSLFIDQTERRFNIQENDIKAKNEFMKKESYKLYQTISRYLPDQSDFTMVETFMFIYNKVVKDWQDKIYQLIPRNLSCIPFKQSMTNKFLSFNVGFKPYKLMYGSGARISEVNEEYSEPAFIIDPEMSFIRKERKSDHFIHVSITEAIDKIFIKICTVLNDLIGAFIGVKFFLRRTLGGCEFGLCFDLDIKHLDKTDIVGENCLIDRDPLLVFTISVRSLAPLLAGVLIFGLVYLVSISGTITEFVTAFPQKVGIELVKKTMKSIFEHLIMAQLEKQIGALCDKVVAFLDKKLVEQIKVIEQFDENLSTILKILSQIVDVKQFDKTGDRIKELFNNKVKVSLSSKIAHKMVMRGIPMGHLIKIGIMLILCLAAFLIGFNNQKKALAESKEEKNAAAFDKDHSNDKKIKELIDKNRDSYKEKDKLSLDS